MLIPPRVSNVLSRRRRRFFQTNFVNESEEAIEPKQILGAVIGKESKPGEHGNVHLPRPQAYEVTAPLAMRSPDLDAFTHGDVYPHAFELDAVRGPLGLFGGKGIGWAGLGAQPFFQLLHAR